MLQSNLLLLVKGSLKRERRIQRERHKSIRFNTQNNNSARAAQFSVTAQTLLPNFMFSGGHEHKPTTFFFFSWTLIQSLKIQPQKKLPTSDNERDGISASHIFKRDVFVAVALVVAYKLPFLHGLTYLSRSSSIFLLHLDLGLVPMISIPGKFTHIFTF